MRRNALRTFTIITLLIMTFSVTAWAVLMLGSVRPEAKQDTSTQRLKSLRDVALERDVELNRERESDAEFTGDLHALVKRANAIVQGRITEAESSFTGNRHIDTYLTVDVQRVLKDRDLGELRTHFEKNALPMPLPLTTPLRVVRSGGVVHVNGHRASVNIKGRDLVTAGKKYIFFLEWSPAYEAYYIIGGVSGAVLVENNRVKPLTSVGEMKRRYEGANLETFISGVMSSN
jgi:hypothetical protein